MTLSRRDVAVYVGALVLGLLGMALYLSAYHVWLDHTLVDQVRQQLTVQQQPRK